MCSLWLVVFAAIAFFSARYAFREAERRHAREHAGFDPPLPWEGSGQRCPFCHDGLSGTTRTCRSCEATYHDECLAEAGGCVTLGCANGAEPRRLPGERT
ncbi:MAG: hypothetical protein D6731_17275 [Planctomycetota bacterium]|nr:MAG: hypothetical protein D6731_17275 [Planctomycetota bacterium]